MTHKYADDSLALHTDAYELSMIETYWRKGIANRNAIFEVYFRDLPLITGMQFLQDWKESLTM